jgi:asparagine synthase (glutamine-hydrolysing)
VSDLESLPTAVWHGEDLLLGAGPIGLMRVAQAAAAQLKVVLTGEGSDEILGGYSWYPTMRLLEPVFRLPQPVRRWLAALPAIRRRWPGAAGTLAGPRQVDFERYSRSVSPLRAQGAEMRVLAPGLRDRLHRLGNIDDAVPTPQGFDAWHPFTQMQYFDLKHRMPDIIVQSLDRSTMAYSVEARVPFLDHELVEFCARIPPRFKMKWLREKHILRRAMAGVLPPDIRRRKKYAMQMPTRDWLRGDLPPFAEELLSEAALRDTGYFDPHEVAVLRRRHREGVENLEHVLSMVLGVQVWHEVFRQARRHEENAPCVTA